MQLLASEEYGLRCLLQVAGAPDGAPVSISQISAAEGISPEYTAKLMRELRLGELVHSTRGAEGGYRLARPAREISVWAALQVLGGSLYSEAFCDCHPGQRDCCVRRADCSIRALWRTLEGVLRDTLERISLSDLARDEHAMGSWLDPVSLAVLSQNSSKEKTS
jgi:Rrf2 family protein